MSLTYGKFQPISLKDSSQFDERWLKDRIAEDPALLGLGDLVLKDVERQQPQRGRLDLLFQDAEELPTRYEVEVQLGKTDEAHIIRTIEYWDIERGRYPQYSHKAVLIAEDITSRFLNVIGLFSGFIPLAALQLTAVTWDNTVGLQFTKVYDTVPLGLVDDDEGTRELTDRAYWERRGSKGTVAMTDELLTILRDRVGEPFELSYTKYYIGLTQEGRPSNFVVFRPQKGKVRVELRLAKDAEVDSLLESANLDTLDYSARLNRYILLVTKHELNTAKDALAHLFARAYQDWRPGVTP